MTRPRAVGATVLLLLAAGLATNPPEPAAADTVIAPTTTHDERDPDDGKLSLREAVELANATSGRDTVALAPGRNYLLDGACSFDLSDQVPELHVTDPDGLVIQGNGSTIRQVGPGGGFCGARVLHNEDGALELRDVTLTGGNAELFCSNHPSCPEQDDWGRGGAVYSVGPVVLDGVSLDGNRADLAGGGLAAEGDVTVIDSSINANRAGVGGGLDAAGVVTLQGAWITGNHATPWTRDNGVLHSGTGGGATSDTSITLTRSIVSDNVAEGVSGSFADGGTGGGLRAPTVDATASLITRNEAETVFDDYIGVDRSGEGGGIYSGTITLTRTTLVDNVGDIGAALRASQLAATMSVIGGAPELTSCVTTGAVTSGGYNVVGGGTCGLGAGVGDRTHVPVPGFRFSGGFTPEENGVLAIIPPAQCGPDPDREGTPRPQGGACEAGAEEVPGAAGPHVTPTVLEPHGLSDVPAPISDAVDWATTHGVLTGSNGLFRPTQAITRGQGVAVIWRMMGTPRVTTRGLPFTDVPRTAAYRPALKWALTQGIVVGSPGTRFRPREAIDRASFVSLLWRAAGAPANTPDGWPNVFSDVDGDAAYALAVNWAAFRSLLPEAPDHRFGPTRPMRRSAAAQLLYLAVSSLNVWPAALPPTHNR